MSPHGAMLRRTEVLPLIKLNEVGAFCEETAAKAFQVRFGLYLPGIQAVAGFAVVVRVIHTDDRFDPEIPTTDFELVWQKGSPLDLWTVNAPLDPVAGSKIGLPGVHLYRFELRWTPVGGQQITVSPWITDPFAKAAEIGNMAAVTVGPADPAFTWTDVGYKTPELDDLVVYELHVEEFNDTFDGVAHRLIYLKSLGVNCIELMPVYSMKLDFDWGYGPLYYFAPSTRFGGSAALKRLVNAAHGMGMAVILDVVYEHTDWLFPYYCVYHDLASVAGAPQVANPIIHGVNQYGFGPKPDFTLALTQEYFLKANQMWLDEYHVDGFRYDEVTDLYVPPMDAGYRALVLETYQYSLGLSRFQGSAGSYSRLIQVAETLDLGRSQQVLSQSVTNCVWQNGLLALAEGVASGAAVTDSYAHQLDPNFIGFPQTTASVDATGKPISMPVAPFQYLESHDHSQLICFAGPGDPSDPIPEGDRSKWYKLQPHAIALYTLQGIPMLWQGQEFADNYGLPDTGMSRIHLERVTHWEYFYDDFGKPLVTLYRRLGVLRTSVRGLRSRHSFYYNQQSLQGNQVLIYSRHAEASAGESESWALVLLNFAEWDATLDAPFPVAGTWREMIDDSLRAVPLEATVKTDGALVQVTVNSNYGQVWVKLS